MMKRNEGCFLILHTTEGIEASDDPLIPARSEPHAYLFSAGIRSHDGTSGHGFSMFLGLPSNDTHSPGFIFKCDSTRSSLFIAADARSGCLIRLVYSKKLLPHSLHNCLQAIMRA